MNFDNYECDGQMELVDYLDKLAAETKKCEGCIYFGHDFKCVRERCHKLDQAITLSSKHFFFEISAFHLKVLSLASASTLYILPFGFSHSVFTGSHDLLVG